ncbi:MAG: DUF1643 domain-containing protein [Aliishimia sp.]
MSNPQDQHDPGGKTRLRLPDGVIGTAEFSECGRYRHALTRDWTHDKTAPKAILFVGLNPSIAGADVSDPTCHRELTFAQDWGFSMYLKANLLDWRATSPKDIPHDPKLARSVRNMQVLTQLAEQADTLVMASGKVHKRYVEIADETITVLQKTGKPLICLGHNKDGSAKHPLYIRRDMQPIPY